MKIMGTPL